MRQKIKFCFLVGYFPDCHGGAEHQAYLLSRYLDRGKYDIFFISTGGNKNGLQIVGDDRIYFLKTMRCLKKFGRYYFANYHRIKQILQYEKPDIVYQRIGSSYTGLLAYFSSKLKFRFVWSSASPNDVQKLRLNFNPLNILTNIDELLRVYGVKRAEKILLQSSEQEKLLKGNFSRDGLILRNSDFVPRINSDKLKKLNQLIWVGNIKSIKNPEDFINLVHKLKDTNITFVMVGRKGANKYQQKVEQLMDKQCNLVYFPGLPNEDVNSRIQESLLLINTSYREGFPNTFIQAWMRYVPVVSLHVDPDRFIQNYEIGFFANDNLDKMADFIRNIIANPEKLKEMGKRARAVAIEHFDIKNNHKLFLEIISS
jgi:glycosyltransferase involved in cell wall biosynthesis